MDWVSHGGKGIEHLTVLIDKKSNAQVLWIKRKCPQIVMTGAFKIALLKLWNGKRNMGKPVEFYW